MVPAIRPARASRRRSARPALAVLAALPLTGGCPVLEAVGERVEDVARPSLPDVSGAWTRVEALLDPTRESAYVAAAFERHEVPHTLLAAPIAEGATLTSRFGYRRDPTGERLLPRRHRGVDWAAPTGTPVLAAGDGTVVAVKVGPGYGNHVRIAHDNGFETLYAHLDAFAEGLAPGAAVARGQPIGTVGSTGRSTAAHLHYELAHRGRRIDPLFGR